MTRAVGRSLELFYIDGHADGMLTAELYNWTGHVLMAPRTQLADALRRPEPKCTGVYLLLSEQDGEPIAYIGESDDVGQRLKSHDLNKDWWTSVVFITTAGNKLNKAHVRYLEARLISEAKRIGRSAGQRHHATCALPQRGRYRQDGSLSGQPADSAARRAGRHVHPAHTPRHQG